MKRMLFISALLSSILIAGCINEPPLKVPFEGFDPVVLDDGWPLSTPSQENIDSTGLIHVFEDFHADEAAWQVRSLSVFRNGRLLAESYTKDEADRAEPRAIWSCTKQFMGILVGIAVDRGIIESIEDPISKYLPEIAESHPDKAAITIHDLLTMRSGIGYRNYGISGDDSKVLQQIPDSYLNFILDKPLVDAPGSEFTYKDSDPQLLSSLLQRATGMPVDAWASEVLFRHIGYQNSTWKRYLDGSTLGSFGIMTTPREMAKLAQLACNRGTWNGASVVSAAWIDAMTAPQVEAGDKHFGYLWWSYPEYDTYFMSGNGRQLAFVFPAKNLIVVITSESNVQGKFNLPTPTGRDYATRIAALCE